MGAMDITYAGIRICRALKLIENLKYLMFSFLNETIRLYHLITVLMKPKCSCQLS